MLVILAFVNSLSINISFTIQVSMSSSFYQDPNTLSKDRYRNRPFAQPASLVNQEHWDLGVIYYISNALSLLDDLKSF